MTEKVCVIGLGNPGPRYHRTRHNIGFLWVDSVLAQLKAKGGFSEKFHSHWLAESWEDFEIHFLKPQTFMNNSGRAYADWKQKYQGDSRVLVVLDDLDLPMGKIRFRPEGSDGGHRGLRSIIEASGTQQIPRLRLGIGRPAGETVDYVLDKFEPSEKDVVEKVLGSAFEQLQIWLKAKNADEVMNKINGAKFHYGS